MGGCLLATAGCDNTARIWDPDTGQTLRVLTGHTRSVYSVAWGNAPDGRLLLATGGTDQTARIWDPDTGETLHVLTGHPAACTRWPGGTARTDASTRLRQRR